VDPFPAGGRNITFSGTVRQIDSALGTRIHRYRWHGETHFATAVEPTIPLALTPVVHGFAALHDFGPRPQSHAARPVAGTLRGSSAAAVPQIGFGGTNFLAPGDFATIYDGVSARTQGLTGTGHSIVILGQASIHTADISSFFGIFSLSAAMPTVINYLGTPPSGGNDEFESDLDLEWSAAIAPGASITFVTSPPTQGGVYQAAVYAVNNNVGDVISLSYGGCEAANGVSGTVAWHDLWRQAAAQGTSVFVSSGDSGAAGCDADTNPTATGGLGVNALCTSPYSTCVGGTEFSADVGNPSAYWSGTNGSALTSALGYIGEAVWNESAAVGGSALYATGGGQSVVFPKPPWQYLAGPSAAGPTLTPTALDGVRDVPDVSLSSANHDARFTCYQLLCPSTAQQVTTLYGAFGTSAAAPSMAGIAALVAQQQGKRLGNINPVLYGLSRLQAAGGIGVFHRISSGNNGVPGLPSVNGQTGFTAGTEPYNLATGLGSVDIGALLKAWTSAPALATGLSPANVVISAAQTAGAVTLTQSSSTSWKATTATNWLGITPASGSGSAALSFTALANPSTSPRTGTITIAGLILTVVQAAASSSNGAAVVSLSPKAIAFGSAALGTTAAAQRVVVSNSGNATLTLSYAGIGGAQPGDFSASGNCLAGSNLIPPGGSCFLDVAFSPSADGARSASLSFMPQGLTAFTVALSGTGTGSAPLNTGDVPLPPWSLGLLGICLWWVAARAAVSSSRAP
jgi:subtilase family serine protease